MHGFVGVKSLDKSPQVLTYDGQPYHFGGEGEADNIRILTADVGIHADTRTSTMHAKDSGGKMLPHLVSRKLFKIIPLDEAIKAGATVEENPVVVQARRLAQAKAEEKKQLLAELKDSLKEDVMKDLKAQGWKAPQESTRGGK